MCMQCCANVNVVYYISAGEIKCSLIVIVITLFFWSRAASASTCLPFRFASSNGFPALWNNGMDTHIECKRTYIVTSGNSYAASYCSSVTEYLSNLRATSSWSSSLTSFLRNSYNCQDRSLIMHTSLHCKRRLLLFIVGLLYAMTIFVFW